ncbi:MAG: DUF1080 domain-containing protein [Pedosphaera sp.]|nr:DUF1080 domain-containing protein [Pedosphaera sp.]
MIMKTQLQALLGAVLLTALMAVAADEKKQPKVGYTDTPLIPGQKWRVHDADRPQPKVAKPEASPTLGAKPPKDAVVLFDGTDLAQWAGGKWKVENGYMEINKTGGVSTKEPLGSMQLHLEFASPKEVKGDSQGRGNSGVIIMGKYEVQVLDSYENVTYADGQCASLYGQYPPDVNVSLPPGEWQTYDIEFHAPQFSGDKLEKPARITVKHNGVVVHNDREILGAVSHRGLPKYAPHAAKLPLQLQDHGNPVRYRNIWAVPLAN